MTDYALRPIGYVRAPAPDPEAVPYNGGPAVLELLAEHAGAARGLEPGFVWVITWLHRAGRPPADPPGSARGSLASRTPSRPNPVGVTAARLLRVEGRALHLDALDACDGTPLLDVKPYVREFDCVFGPADPAWRRAARPEQRLARLARTIERFCGPLTGSLALAARIALAADRDLDTPANSPSLTWICRCPLPVAAGLQAVSGAPLADPRLDLGPDEGRVTVQGPGRRARYRLRVIPADPDAALRAPEGDLLEAEEADHA